MPEAHPRSRHARRVDCVHVRVNVELDAHRLIDGDVPQDVVRSCTSQSTTRVTLFALEKEPDRRAARRAHSADVHGTHAPSQAMWQFVHSTPVVVVVVRALHVVGLLGQITRASALRNVRN